MSDSDKKNMRDSGGIAKPWGGWATSERVSGKASLRGDGRAEA